MFNKIKKLFNIILVFICLLAQSSIYLLNPAEVKATAVNVIFDTDAGEDSDDIAGLSILQTLQDNGECNILAILGNTGYNRVIYAAQAISAWWGRDQIPMGSLAGYTEPSTDTYANFLASKFPDTLSQAGSVENATITLRRILAAQGNGTVTYICTGQLRNIYNLYNSAADIYSPLTGAQLISAKISKFSIMGGDTPTGSEHNFTTDGTAAEIINSLSTPCYFTGFTIGHSFEYTVENCDVRSPLRQGHIARSQYYGEAKYVNNTYDLLACLYAVRGLSYGGNTYFTVSAAGDNVVASNGANTFTVGTGNDYYLGLGESTSDLATQLDAILTTAHTTYSLSSYSYYKTQPITGSADGTQTNYPIKIVVYKTTGSDSGSDVYVGTHVKDNFNDVRFTDSTGSTQYSFYKGSYTPGVSATFWVKIPSIPTSPATTIRVYYGFAGAEYASDGNNTFQFYDDFNSGFVIDSSKWTATGSWTIAGGDYLKSPTGYNTPDMTSSFNTTLNQCLEYDVYWESGTYFNAASTVLKSANWQNTGYRTITHNGATWELNCGGTVINSTSVTFAKSHWYHVRLFYQASYQKCDLDYANTLTAANTTYSSAAPLVIGENVGSSEPERWDNLFIRNWTLNEPTYGTWGAETGLAVPAAPTNVSATDGTYTDKVTITWTKSDTATGYYVYEGTNVISGLLGDVATYDDTEAGAPTITAGTASATDGTYQAKVALSLSGTSRNNGTSRTYKVVATNANGNSTDSSTDTGYRGTTTLTYQWQRSAADSDASYSNIGTTASYDDTTAPADGSGRYYKCTISMTDATPVTTTANRGYRSTIPTIADTISSAVYNLASVLPIIFVAIIIVFLVALMAYTEISIILILMLGAILITVGISMLPAIQAALNTLK